MKAFFSGLIVAAVLAVGAIFLYSSFGIDAATGYRPAPHVHLD